MIGRFAGITTPVAWRGTVALLTAAAFMAELVFPWEHAPVGGPLAVAGPAELPHAASTTGGTYAAINEHPLFQPSRAPWVAPPPPAVPPAGPAAAAPPPNYILGGVVVSGASRSAIVHSANAPTAVVVNEGQTLDGWTLRRIDPTGLHFESGGQTFDLGFPTAGQSGR